MLLFIDSRFVWEEKFPVWLNLHCYREKYVCHELWPDWNIQNTGWKIVTLKPILYIDVVKLDETVTKLNLLLFVY